MAVRDIMSPRQAEPPAPERALPSFLDRMNAFGERHAKAIIIASTALIIVTVLIFAQILWQRSLFDRLERDLADAESTERLSELKKKYAGTRGEARVLATLGHEYYAKGDLRDALSAYDEFLERFPEHPLKAAVDRSRKIIRESLDFEESQKEARDKEMYLNAHPLHRPQGRESLTRAHPVKEAHPVVQLKFKNKPDAVFVELFEDEAPNTVANFVSLVEKKYFDGLAFHKSDGDERLQIEAKTAGAVDYRLEHEKTFREGDIGMLVMVRRPDGSGNAGAQFQILLKSVADLQNATVFGQVLNEEAARDFIEAQRKAGAQTPVLSGPLDAMSTLRALDEKENRLETVEIARKREHPYEPRVVSK
ncbi:MAG: peptidylprolyl isomerase [Planctomycetes bacterium]|nr:peptidylprolyl isomerase [Planctomycetota bacterium]